MDKTLMTLYREREAALKKQLDAAGTVDDAVAVLVKELAWLEGVVGGGLTIPQQRAFQAMLEVVRGSLRGVKDGVRLERFPQRQGALAQIWGVLLRALGLARPTVEGQVAEGGGEWYRVRLDSAAFLAHFAHQLSVIDRWLADQPVPATGDDPREMVELMQRLTADARAHDTELLYERLEQLPQVLERYGMRLVDYDPRQSPRLAEMRRLFRFEANLDPRQTTPQTLVPAVVKGDTVVLRGLVVQPTA